MAVKFSKVPTHCPMPKNGGICGAPSQYFVTAQVPGHTEAEGEATCGKHLALAIAVVLAESGDPWGVARTRPLYRLSEDGAAAQHSIHALHLDNQQQENGGKLAPVG